MPLLVARASWVVGRARLLIRSNMLSIHFPGPLLSRSYSPAASDKYLTKIIHLAIIALSSSPIVALVAVTDKPDPPIAARAAIIQRVPERDVICRCANPLVLGVHFALVFPYHEALVRLG